MRFNWMISEYLRNIERFWIKSGDREKRMEIRRLESLHIARQGRPVIARPEAKSSHVWLQNAISGVLQYITLYCTLSGMTQLRLIFSVYQNLRAGCLEQNTPCNPPPPPPPPPWAGMTKLTKIKCLFFQSGVLLYMLYKRKSLNPFQTIQHLVIFMM